MASAAELVVVLSAKDQASKVLSGFGQQLGGMSGLAKVATAGLATVAAAGLGLATGLVSSIGAAMDFEAAMSGVAAVAGASDKELQTLSDTALQLGQDTSLSGIGATEAATAMRELAAAGMSVQDIVGGGALGALRLASAGGIDVGRAAEIAAMALANFGLAGADAARVADLFAAASNESAISVDDIAESMKYVGPIANSMGLSIEEVTATIAALGNQGIKGSAAGTALRSMLVNLSSPSKEASKVINELGLEFFDTNGQMKSLADVSGELRGKMEGLTDQQRAHALSTLFGNEALTAATVLYGEGAAGINKWLNEIENGATAAEVGAMRNNNLKGSIEALKGSFETAQIALGMAFLPALKQLVDLATQATNASIPLLQAWGPRFAGAISAGLGALPALVDRASAAIGGLVTAFKSLASGDINGMFGPILAAIEAAFGPDAMARVAGGVNIFLTALQQVRDMVNMARDAFNQLPVPIQQLIAGFLALGPAVRIVGVALPLLVGALTGLGPIVSALATSLPVLGTIIAALGAPITALIVVVGALAVAWATNWLGIRDATMPVITEIVAFITGTLLPGLMQLGTFLSANVVPAFMAGWAQIQAAVTTAIAAIMPVVQQFADWFTNSLLPAVQQATATVIPAVTQMGAAVVSAFRAALPGIQSFIAGMQSLGAAVLPILASVASTIMGTLGPAVLAIAAWANEVIPQFAAAWTNVMSIVGPIVGQLASMIGTALSTIAGFITAHSAEIQGILSAAWLSMSSMIGAVLTVITGLISSALLAISGDWEGAWNRLVQTVTTAGQQFTTSIQAAMTAIVGYMALGMSGILSAMQAAWAGIVSAAQSAGQQMVTTAQSTASQLPGAFLSIVGAMAAAGAAAGAAAIDGITGALSAGLGRVRDIASQIASTVAGALADALRIHSPSKVTAEIGREVVNGLVAGMDDKEQDAAKKAADVASAIAKAVTDTLGAMKVLADFDFAADSPTGEDMGWFRHLTESLLATLSEAAAAFEAEAMEHATKFADTVSKVGSAVKSAVDGLLALGQADWATSSPDGNAMAWFTHLMASLVQNFASAAKEFEEGALESAGKFAEAAGKVAGVIGPAVAGFKDLATLAAPSETAIDQLMAGIRYIVRKFAEMAAMLDTEGAKHLADFSTAAGNALAAAKTGTELFKAFDKLGIPSAKAIDELMEAIKYVVRRFGEMAKEVSEEGLTQLKAFASAAGESLKAAKEGTDLFKAMEKLAVPSAEAIDFLLGTIEYIINRIREIARSIGVDGLAEAQSFAAGSFNVISTLATGLKLFEELAKFNDIPKEKLREMWKALEGALEAMGDLVSRSDALKNSAYDYLANMEEAARIVAQAQSIGNGMGSIPVPSAPMGVGGNSGGGGGGNPGGIGGKPVYVTVNNPVSLSRDSAMAQQIANVVTGAQNKQIGYSI